MATATTPARFTALRGRISLLIADFVGVSGLAPLLCTCAHWRASIEDFILLFLADRGRARPPDRAAAMRAFRGSFARELLHLPAIKDTAALKALAKLRGPFNFLVGSEVERVHAGSSHTLLKVGPRRYLYSAKALQPSASNSLRSLQPAEAVEDAVQVQVAAGRLCRLGSDGQLYTRQLSGSAAEQRVDLAAAVAVFGPAAVDCVRFFFNDAQLFFLGGDGRVYLLSNFRELCEARRPTACGAEVFRVHAAEPARSFAVARGSLFLLGASGVPHELKLSQQELRVRQSCFLGSKNAQWLSFEAAPIELFRRTPISRVFPAAQLVLFEHRAAVKPLEELGVAEVAAWLAAAGVPGLEKLLTFNRIDGARLAAMSAAEMEALFVSGGSRTDLCRIADCVRCRRHLRAAPPRLFIAGHNPQRLLGLGEFVGHFAEVELPRFELNEQLAEVVVGSHNVALLTTANRCFLSVNEPAEEADEPPPPRKLSGRAAAAPPAKERRRPRKQRERPRAPRFAWIDLKALLAELAPWQAPGLELDVHDLRAQPRGFTVLAATNQRRRAEFGCVRELLAHLRSTCAIDKRELQFVDGARKAVYSYDEILMKERKLDGVTAVRWQPANKLIWSAARPRLDSRVFDA